LARLQPPWPEKWTDTFAKSVSAEAPLFPTGEGAFFKSTESFGKVSPASPTNPASGAFHAHLLRHTWATNWMKQPGADLLTLMRQGGWKRLQMVERYSHAIPVKHRSALPNPAPRRRSFRSVVGQSRLIAKKPRSVRRP
jgi:integrase